MFPVFTQKLHTEWTCGHRGEGEGGTNCKNSIEIYALPFAKQIASGRLRYSPGSSAQCSVKTWSGGWESAVGGRLKRGGMYVNLQLIHIVVWQKLTQHYTAFLLQ